MKRILFLFIIALTTFLLTGCSDPIVSETGYDLQGLDECIDAMVDADSNQACDETTKNKKRKMKPMLNIGAL